MASEMVNLQIPREEYERIVALAQQRGYESPDAYVLALVEEDAEDEIEDDDIDPVESFRQAWHEAMTGQSRPIEELWDLLRKHGYDHKED